MIPYPGARICATAIVLVFAACPVLCKVSFERPFRLRGGSFAVGEIARPESLPNPRAATPRNIATKIQFVPAESSFKQISQCKVLGSWSNWQAHEALHLNTKSGQWETTMLLPPGIYKVDISIN